MKITANREGLLTAFSLAASVVPSRPVKPILSNCKLDASAGNNRDGKATVNPKSTVTVTATDMELAVVYSISGVEVREPGSVLLPANQFIAILRELDDETIDIETSDSDGGNAIFVTGDASKFELPVADPMQFPAAPTVNGESHTINASVLSLLIKRVAFAVAKENSRYALASVLLEFVNGAGNVAANFVATDGKRLAFMSGPATGSATGSEKSGGPSTLFSPKSLSLIQKILIDPESSIEFITSHDNAIVRSEKATIFTRLVEGRYPRYMDVFPPPAKMNIQLNVGAFLKVLRQAKIVTSEESKGVDFEFSDGTLKLKSQAVGHGQSVISMAINPLFGPIKITFDPQFVIDALRLLEPEKNVTLGFVDGKRAGLLTTDDGYRYVVMPLTRERGEGKAAA